MKRDTTRDEKTGRKLNMGERYADAKAEAEKPELHIGVIPDIFGYGMTVAETSQAKAEAALRAKYAEWKADRKKHIKGYDETETNFDKSFEDFGGYYKRVELGKVYYDNFAE